MDRAYPGAGACLSSSLLTTKVGRLVLAEFSDPDRLAQLGVERFYLFATNRDVIVQRPPARRFVAARRRAVNRLAREADAVDLPLPAIETLASPRQPWDARFEPPGARRRPFLYIWARGATALGMGDGVPGRARGTVQSWSSLRERGLVAAWFEFDAVFEGDGPHNDDRPSPG